MQRYEDYGSIDVQHTSSSSVGDENAPPSSTGYSRRALKVLFASSFFLAWLVLVVAHQHDDDHNSGSSQSLLLMSFSSSAAGVGSNKKNPTKKSYSSTPRFYNDQRVDHFDPTNMVTWSHRYYARKKYFKGPGHPIILEIGGEGGNDVGFFYGFVDKVLAKKFGAYVLHPEHRFYGVSQPVPNATNAQLVQLLTPEQAMTDMLQLANHYRRKLGCSMDQSHKDYCPIITNGGSYPGFLAAMMRFLYPDSVDIAYASSAPLKLYDKTAPSQYGYFDVVTQAADRASPGCAAATKQALTTVFAIIKDLAPEQLETFATEQLGICPGSIPKYIDSGPLFAEELMQIIEPSFADANMVGNYPPSNRTWFAQLCHVFQDNNKGDAIDKVREFWKHLEVQDKSVDCFVMDIQLSEGRKATISSADWTGSGPGWDGTMWDFQCCYSLIPEVGFSEQSMFPPREWTYEWLTKHCMDRFGVVGDPYGMVNQWHFDDLIGQGASRILFTNGGNDLWSAGSYLTDLSESIVAINMPNGGHHSEVYGLWNDTEDVIEAQKEITEVIGGWLKEFKMEGKTNRIT